MAEGESKMAPGVRENGEVMTFEEFFRRAAEEISRQTGEDSDQIVSEVDARAAFNTDDCTPEAYAEGYLDALADESDAPSGKVGFV